MWSCFILTIVNAIIWSDWKVKYNKNYNVTEEKYRHSIWKDNLEKIQTHNKDNSTYRQGLNMFSDWTNEEYLAWLGSYPYPTNICDKINNQTNSLLNGHLLPEVVDWRKQNAVTPVKNQSNCKSYYSFAAVASLESAMKITTGVLYSLSEQQIIDCSNNKGCDGGLVDEAFEYVK